MKALSNKYLATLLLSLTAKAALGERLVDPTRPATAKPVATGEHTGALRLEAILRSDDGTVAIVNGKIVRVGDRIGTARIDAIEHDGIRYTRDGRSHTARMAAKPLQVRRNVVSSEDGT